MLLLLFALLNAFCLSHCTHDVITSIKEFNIRNKRSRSKITFQALVQNKKEGDVILLQANKHVNHVLVQKLNNAFWQRKPKVLGDFGINSRLPLKIDSLGLLREKRHIKTSERDLVSTQLAPQTEEPTSLMQNSTTYRPLNEMDPLEYLKRKPDYPKVVLPVQKLFADVGVSFQKYLSPDIFHDSRDGNANSLNIELLTADGKKLFATSWIKFDQSNLKLFGFPLKGNQHEHSFILKATNRKGKSVMQKVTIVVHALEPLLNHYIHLCTTMTLSEYGGSVERRLRLAKAIANYIFPGLRTENVWIWKFQKGCMYLSFRHLPRKGKCDFDALQTIEEKILDDGELNSDFQQALKGITDIVSVNLTVQYECRKSNSTIADDDLGWLRDIAPIFILLAVVAVPTLISCIVCREVRRRQATMRQLQDRRMKEDREQMLIQAAEYKHECGLDSESDDAEECTNRPYRQQEEDSKKFFGFSRIADIILPEVVIDTVKQGTEILSTFLPQETRDSASNDEKVGITRRFTMDTVSHSLNKLNVTSQEEIEHSIDKPESSLTSKVKGVLNFMKSPLDITPFDYNLDSVENRRGAQMKAVEGRKLSKIPAQTLLPSISSLFGLNTNDVAHGSLREVKERMSTSIRQKFQLMVNAASSNRNKENSEEQVDERISNVEAPGLSDKRIQSFMVSQIRSTAPATYIDFPASASVLAPPMRARVGIPGPRALLDGKVVKRDTEGEGIEGGIKNIGLFNRMLYQSRNLVNSARKWSSTSKDSQDSMQLKKVAKGNWDCDLDYKRRLSIAYNSATSCEAENSKNQMFSSIYDDYGNLFNKYNSTPENCSAENRRTDLIQESNQASNVLQAVVRNQELLESADRYFVNIGEEQVGKELSLIEATDANWRQVEFHPERQESDGKQMLEKFQPSINERLNLEKESCFGYSGKADENILRGLKHYDPDSGTWYLACNSLKERTQTEKMSSLLEGFKGNGEGNMSQSCLLKSRRVYRSNLRWHEINREPERQVQIEKDWCKNDIEVGTMLDQNSSNLYEQSIESESNYESNQTCCKGGREEPKGVWTESIYDGYMEDNDLCQTSEEETDLQVLINKMQDESLHHRYVPNEIKISDSYLDESMYRDRYGEDQAGHLESASADPVSNSIGHDCIDIINPYHVHFTYSEEEKCPTQQSQRHLDETGLPHQADSDREIVALISKENATEKGSKCDCFATAEEHHEEVIKGRGRSFTDGQLQLSMTYLREVESPTRSEPGYTAKIKVGAKTQKQRRSFLERQRRVEIPEKLNAFSDQLDVPTIHINPIFVSEERKIKDGMEERRLVEDRFDFATIKRMQSINELSSQSSSRMRKHAYSGQFLTANVEAEKFRKQDADIIELQTKGYFERRRQNMQHLGDKSQLGKPSLEELEPFALSNRTRREDTQRRTGIRRFSTPSMESWTSTPEKYYYDATGDQSMSEDDVNCTGLRKGNEKNPVASGKGRAKEYTQRLLQGVSPRIRRHSTSILGQRCGGSQSGNTLTNTGTFLGRIGEGKFVQTIQTKLGKKDSRAEESKSPITKEKEKNIEEEKQLKGSTLTAIRNTLLLLSGGK